MRGEKTKRIIFLLSIGIITCLISTSEVFADTSEVQIDVLLKNDTDIDSVKQEVLTIDSAANFEEIPEIQLLRVKSSSEAVSDEIKKNKNIESTGKLADIFIEDKRLINQKSLLNKAIIPEAMFFEEPLDEFALLDQFAWYKNTMLGDRQVLEQSAGKGVQIGLIDSGIDVLHPLLSPAVDLTRAKSFVTSDGSIADNNGHGTMVAGIITQLAPQAKITPYRVLSADGGESFWTLEAIIQAVNDKQDIVNMSLGTYKHRNIEAEKITIESFERAIAYALKNNVIVIASSGNKGLDLDSEFESSELRHLPGSVSGVLSTSAITIDNTLASYSNVGSNIQHTAPGGDYVFNEGILDVSQLMYTAYPTTLDNMLGSLGIPQGYMFSAGTSLSAPCISGIVADYLTYHKQMTGKSPTVEQVKKDFAATSIDLGIPGKNKFYGYGLPKIADVYHLVPDLLPPTGRFKEQTVEINEPKKAEEFISDCQDNSGKEVKISYLNEPDFTKLGRQEVQIKLEDTNGNQTELIGMITISDTQAPTGKFVEQVVEVNEPNRAEEYVKELQDNSKDNVRVRFITDPNFGNLGQQEVIIQLEDTSGNQTHLAGLVIVKDTLAPSATVKNIKLVKGEELHPEMFLDNITDNYDAKQVTLSFVKSISTEEIGKQEVEIRLSDPSENVVILTGELEVVEEVVGKNQTDNVTRQTLTSKKEQNNNVEPKTRKNLALASRDNLPNTSEQVVNFSFIGYGILGGAMYWIRRRYGSEKQ